LRTGYYYTGTAGTFPNQLTNDNVLVCTKGYYCAGGASIDTASTSAQGRVQCQQGTTTASAAITNAAATDCTILLPTWHHNGQATDVDANTIIRCPANGYCPGSCASGTCTPETYTDTAPSGITECPGYTCDASTTAGTAASCTQDLARTPRGGAGTSTTPQSSVAGCDNLDAGYYYNPDSTKTISLTTIVECPADNWCDGSAKITLLSAITGISGTCPTAGSTSAAGSGAADDCTVEAGYYYTGIGGVLNDNTIQPCKPGFYCPGLAATAFTITGGEQGANACAAGSTCTGILCKLAGDCAP
jgi:hypothetical protein